MPLPSLREHVTNLGLILLTAVWCTSGAVARSTTPDAHFDRMFGNAKSEVDAWTREQVQGVHDVIASVLEEARIEHEEREAKRSLVDASLLEEGSGSRELSKVKSGKDEIHGDGAAVERPKSLSKVKTTA